MAVSIRRASIDAIPSPSLIIFGSSLWGLIIASTAMTGMWMQNAMLVGSPLAIASIYFYGSALGFAPAIWLCRMILARRGRLLRLVGSTIIIALATHTAAATVFALQYRIFYSYWHAGFPSLVWFFQLFFTSAGAVYIFTVDSLYDYWPLTTLAFVAFGLWFARKGAARPKAH